MSEEAKRTVGQDGEGDPPLGSWSRVYLLTLLAAVAVMLLLYWFTRAWHEPLEAR